MGRAYRIVRELHHPVPYVVQGLHPDEAGYWADVARFGRPEEARLYLVEVLVRGRVLEDRS